MKCKNCKHCVRFLPTYDHFNDVYLGSETVCIARPLMNKLPINVRPLICNRFEEEQEIEDKEQVF